MKSAVRPGREYSLKAISRSVNRPSIALAAIALALTLGAMRVPFLEYLRPIGDFYVALLRICVLPFLLATIPLAVRSAMVNGSVGGVVRSLVIWLFIAVVAVAVASVVVTSSMFHYVSPDEHVISNIGELVGRSAYSIDLEFAVDPGRAIQTTAGGETGVFAIIPTNIFASLSANDSVRVLVFAALFGVGMVVTERESGHSIFGALRHIQAVCIRIFDWFSLLVPIGIVALIAPQVALLGSDAFVVLALFGYALLATSLLLLLAVILTAALSLRETPGTVFAALLKPVMLGASTRNTLICIPIALETLKDDLKVEKEPCDLFVPIGFATIRFGTILYFVTATLFMGALMGRPFSLIDLSLVAIFSIGASFATLGLNGVAALVPLAVVLRPFGLSYEVAVPLMMIIDPIAEMIRVTLNVAINCLIPILAVGRKAPKATQAAR
jgi:proton glutamate symport protein